MLDIFVNGPTFFLSSVPSAIFASVSDRLLLSEGAIRVRKFLRPTILHPAILSQCASDCPNAHAQHNYFRLSEKEGKGSATICMRYSARYAKAYICIANTR